MEYAMKALKKNGFVHVHFDDIFRFKNYVLQNLKPRKGFSLKYTKCDHGYFLFKYELITPIIG